MKRFLLLASAAMLIGADSAPEPAPASAPSPAPHLPGFAADLAQQAAITGPTAWQVIPQDQAWRTLATVVPRDRHQARFDYARSMIGQERGAEAFGVLEVMRQDDPDLMMVDAFRLARGAALVQLNRFDEASSDLASPSLAANPEACIWRMRALSASGFSEQALEQTRCAAPAFAGRPNSIFRLAAARAAIEMDKPGVALDWLRSVLDRDPGANLLRGRAELALGKADESRLRFARVEQSGGMALKMDARLSQIEAEIKTGAIKTDEALKRLDMLRYIWRGDAIEERALRLTYRLNADAGDTQRALNAGATLFRFFNRTGRGGEFLPQLQAALKDALDPNSKMPLEQAAGLYWEYRDLAPSGAEGDLLVSRLAQRLQAASMYSRAADLLEYQLFHRAGDLARGALSARVAGLHILAGRSDRALDVIKRSTDPSYPDTMQNERKRVEAVALTHLGRQSEAFAVLQDIPGAAALRAEIMWKQRNWQSLADETRATLPRAQMLSDVDQAVILRHAIALAMLGQEDQLHALRARYADKFSSLKTASVFDMLTGAPGSVDPEKLAQAMAAIPAASAAGDITALLEPTQR